MERDAEEALINKYVSNKESYYGAATITDFVSMGIGMAKAALGLKQIFAGMNGVGTGIVGAPLTGGSSFVISVAGETAVAAGLVETGYGTSVFFSSRNNFKSNYKKFKEAISEGARDPKTLKFSDMSEEEITKVVNKYREKAPIEIPETAKIKPQSKDGYEQISYKWNDGTYKYEARWHIRTPGAPEEQGNTWVIQRTKPGSGGTRPTTEFKIGEDEWIPGYKWYDAIGARKAGTATPEQISILDRGHWKE